MLDKWAVPSLLGKCEQTSLVGGRKRNCVRFSAEEHRSEFESEGGGAGWRGSDGTGSPIAASSLEKLAANKLMKL